MAENLRTMRGIYLTTEVTDALATEAERGYNLSTATVRKMGRPLLEKGVSPPVSFRLTPSAYRAAKARAGVEGRVMSALAREAFERYMQG